jgi:hypothetical protein
VNTDVDQRVRSHRTATDRELEPVAGNTARLAFTNPGPGNSVRAEEFLSHLDLDHPDVRAILAECYPSAAVNPQMMEKAKTRLRFVGWMTMERYDNPHAAHKALTKRPGTAARLGFDEGVPVYETLRAFWHDHLTPHRQARLKAVLLRESKRVMPELGTHQAEDATPVEALRGDETAPYNPHYKTRMHKGELRVDVEHEAILADQFYHGTAHEGRWLNALTARVEDAGVHPATTTVDHGYAGFQNHAATWRHGTYLLYDKLKGWRIDPEAAAKDVEARFQRHWGHEAWPQEADHEAKLRFLIDHGSHEDREAAGRWLRDAALTGRTEDEEALRRRDRAGNEGLNAELKRLPLTPQRRGVLWLFRRFLACTLTLMLVQWTRIQNGVTTGLCRTGYIV